jgi:hypothetical protein
MRRVPAESVRAAVASGDYVEALALWQEYTATMAADKPTRQSLAEAADLIGWSRPLLNAARTHALERLRLLHVAGVYGDEGSVRPSMVVRASL